MTNEDKCSIRLALIAAREKLKIYFKNTNGEYQGGVEYSQLIKLIDKALDKLVW